MAAGAADALIPGLEARYGIPKGLYSRLINSGEASGDKARSPKGAFGRAQLMPGTAADLGVDPNDPAQNVEGGARYLAGLYKQFRSWPLAVAAYNAGPGAVKRYGGVPPYGETQRYVQRVTGGADVPGLAGGPPGAGGGSAALQAALSLADKQTDVVKAREAAARGEADSAEGRAALDASKPEYERIRKGLEEPAPDAPKPPTLPGAPDNTIKDPRRALGQFLPMLAILGGAVSKGHAGNALKAAAAAMKGQREGDADVVKAAHDKWMDETSKLVKQYDLEHNAFQDAIQKHGENRAGLVADMSVLAAEHNIPVLKAQLDAGDVDGAMKTLQARNVAFQPVADVYRQAQEDRFRQEQLDIEAHNAATAEKRLDVERDRIPPLTQAYNSAVHSGKDPEVAMAEAGWMKLAADPSKQQAIREKFYKNDEAGKRVATVDANYDRIMVNLDSDDIEKNPVKQLAVIDTFLRMMTGSTRPGIAQYQKLLSAQSLKDHALLAAGKLGSGPILGPDQLANMRSAIEDEKKGADSSFHDWLMKPENRALAAHVGMEGIQAESAAPAAGGVAQPKSKEEYDALPSGATYIYTDGTTRTKP